VEEISTVLDYLETKVQSKNEEKHLELIGYLNKHRDEIIDYRRRKKAGRMIGSGYIEKVVIKSLASSEEERDELA